MTKAHRPFARPRLLSAVPLLAATLWSLAACGEAPPPDDPPPPEADFTPISVSGVGFLTPEAVVHDATADVYLVSNINGDPFEKDGNGFISRVSPQGEVLELRWIDGEAEGVSLHAPKGMTIVGDRLYVADIDVIRVFDRTDGTPIEEHPVEGAAFLNDIAAGADGALYFTDTGLAPGFEPAGTDAVYALRDGDVTALARGEGLSMPNGIVVRGDAVLVVPFGANTVLEIPTAGGDPRIVATLPGGQLDGLVLVEDGSLLVSSWEAEAVYRVSPDGEVTVAVVDVPAPAAIGYDAVRGRILIPLFMDDALEIRER